MATVAGVGYAPVASGTFGSAAGVILFLPLSRLSFPIYLVVVLAITVLGVWAATESERAFRKSDDGRIVIDEVAGQLLTLAPLVALGLAGSWPLVVTGFVVFRVLDVWKPGPVRWAERSFPGGLGVMADDVLAGLIGALPLAGLALAFGGGPGGAG